ncbi:TIR domain-containing protein [Sorangium sp. So ce429]
MGNHPTVFISYSRHDKTWKDKLAQHLQVLEKQGLLEVWSEDGIGAGEDRRQKIQDAIDRSRVAVILLSADFLNSDLVVDEQLSRLVEKHRADKNRIIPVLIKPCMWAAVPLLAELNVTPSDGTTLAEATGRSIDRQLLEITNKIFEVATTAHVNTASVNKSTTGPQLAREPAMAMRQVVPSFVHFVHTLPLARGWQDRAELEELCSWWRQGGAGVLALVGVGGAGKTALVERFLRLVPQMTAQLPGLAPDPELPVPAGVFVFSFNAGQSPETFFEEVNACLARSQPFPRSVRYGGSEVFNMTSLPLAIDARSTRAGRLLIVLDGLEEVQHHNERTETFGRIEHGALRELLSRAADGLAPRLSFVVTTRFGLTDLIEEQARGAARVFKSIDVRQMTDDACMALLKRSGVKGSDDALARLVEACGWHALTVELAAQYLVHFHGGCADAAINLPTSKALHAIARKKSATSRKQDQHVGVVAEQMAGLERIARSYYEALERTDRAALSLLLRLCLFRLGASEEVLARAFLGPDRKKASGPELSSLSRDDLKAKLVRLIDMRLVEDDLGRHRLSGAEVEEHDARYAVHPALRRMFLALVDPVTDMLVNAAIREALKSVWGERARTEMEPRSDAVTLDLLEELMFHTIQAGHACGALDFYWTYLEPGHLQRLGEYERGDRLCRLFVNDLSPRAAIDSACMLSKAGLGTMPLVDLEDAAHAAIVNEWGMYLSALARINESIVLFEHSMSMSVRRGSAKSAAACAFNRMIALKNAGYLSAAIVACEDGLRFCERAGDGELVAGVRCVHASVRILRAGAEGALSELEDALESQDDSPSFPLFGFLSELVLAGAYDKARRIADSVLRLRQTFNDQEVVAFPMCHLALAETAQQDGNLEQADEHCQAAYTWALQRNARLLLCWAALVRARIALARSHQATRIDLSAMAACGRALEEGLRISHKHGLSIYHIELLLVRAELKLWNADPAGALGDIDTAVFSSSTPMSARQAALGLLAATDPRCAYVWGEARGRRLRAEALLLQAAQRLGHHRCEGELLDSLDEDARALVNEAQCELEAACILQARIKHPELRLTKDIQKALGDGVLTKRPLRRPTCVTLRPDAMTQDALGEMLAPRRVPCRLRRPGAAGIRARGHRPAACRRRFPEVLQGALARIHSARRRSQQSPRALASGKAPAASRPERRARRSAQACSPLWYHRQPERIVNDPGCHHPRARRRDRWPARRTGPASCASGRFQRGSPRARSCSAASVSARRAGVWRPSAACSPRPPAFDRTDGRRRAAAVVGDQSGRPGRLSTGFCLPVRCWRQAEKTTDRLVNDPGRHLVADCDRVGQGAGERGNHGGPRRRVA